VILETTESPATFYPRGSNSVAISKELYMYSVDNKYWDILLKWLPKSYGVSLSTFFLSNPMHISTKLTRKVWTLKLPIVMSWSALCKGPHFKFSLGLVNSLGGPGCGRQLLKSDEKHFITYLHDHTQHIMFNFLCKKYWNGLNNQCWLKRLFHMYYWVFDTLKPISFSISDWRT